MAVYTCDNVSCMSILTDSGPQFGTAEYGGQPGAERCKSCSQLLGARYYRVNGVLACESCVERIKSQSPKDTHAVFIRALLFGVGGAIVGLALYSTFTIVTGLIIGYVSLAVGYIVGKAIMAGSRGIGGRRYQITAVLLTYAAVSMSAIPIGIAQFIKQPKEPRQSQVKKTAPTTTDSSTADSEPNTDESLAPAGQPKISIGSAVAALLFAGLASPFLELQDPVSGGIGIIILIVGIRIAWKLTEEKPIDIVGPFNNSATASAPA